MLCRDMARVGDTPPPLRSSKLFDDCGTDVELSSAIELGSSTTCGSPNLRDQLIGLGRVLGLDSAAISAWIRRAGFEVVERCDTALLTNPGLTGEFTGGSGDCSEALNAEGDGQGLCPSACKSAYGLVSVRVAMPRNSGDGTWVLSHHDEESLVAFSCRLECPTPPVFKGSSTRRFILSYVVVHQPDCIAIGESKIGESRDQRA